MLDLGTLLLTARQIDAFERVLDDPLHQLTCFLLLLGRRVLDGTIRGGVVHVHHVCLLLICLDPVDNYVDQNFPSLRVLGHLDVILRAIKRCEVVGRDHGDFGEKLLFALFGHFALLDGEVENLLIILLRLSLDDAAIVFVAILQLHLHCWCSRGRCLRFHCFHSLSLLLLRRCIISGDFLLLLSSVTAFGLVNFSFIVSSRFAGCSLSFSTCLKVRDIFFRQTKVV